MSTWDKNLKNLKSCCEAHTSHENKRKTRRRVCDREQDAGCQESHQMLEFMRYRHHNPSTRRADGKKYKRRSVEPRKDSDQKYIHPIYSSWYLALVNIMLHVGRWRMGRSVDQARFIACRRALLVERSSSVRCRKRGASCARVMLDGCTVLSSHMIRQPSFRMSATCVECGSRLSLFRRLPAARRHSGSEHDQWPFHSTVIPMDLKSIS